MLKSIPLLLAVIAATSAENPTHIGGQANSEAQIWDLEKAYWEYVKDNDLEKYRGLWHDNFVGWPFVSPEPVRKDHITDWIADNASKGLKLHSYSIEQLAVRLTEDIAVDHYRIKATWARSDTGNEVRTDAIRITHTWVKTNGTWQIIGGMSAPVNAEGK
jgi:uncharacterized protein DUF4440